MVYWYSAADNYIRPHNMYVTTVTDICSDSPWLVFRIFTSSVIFNQYNTDSYFLHKSYSFVILRMIVTIFHFTNYFLST